MLIFGERGGVVQQVPDRDLPGVFGKLPEKLASEST